MFNNIHARKVDRPLSTEPICLYHNEHNKTHCKKKLYKIQLSHSKFECNTDISHTEIEDLSSRYINASCTRY